MNLIEYTLHEKKLTQKKLADRLNVTQAQISKWKAGEIIPYERDEQLLIIAGLFGDDFEWALTVKSEANSNKWIEFFEFCVEAKQEYPVEFGYESIEILMKVFSHFKERGITIPTTPPETGINDESDFEILFFDFLESFLPCVAWVDRHIETDEILDKYPDNCSACDNIRHNTHIMATNLMALDLLQENGVDIKAFEKESHKTLNEIKSWIGDFCEALEVNNIPIRIDYFDYVQKDIMEIDHTLEGQALFESVGLQSLDIIDYLPYGEQLILKKLDETNLMLKKLLGD